MMKADHLVGSERNHRVSSPPIVRELHFGHRRSEQFDNGPHLAAHQAVLGQVLEHGNDSKKFQVLHSVTL